MRRRGLFLTLVFFNDVFLVLFYRQSILYPYRLLAVLFRKLNNFNFTLIVGTSARRRTVYKQFSNQFASFHLQNCRKNKHVIHRPRSVRIGKNFALGLEYGPRPAALGRTQNLGHSFSLYRPPGR